jgi:hypothetical protein
MGGFVAVITKLIGGLQALVKLWELARALWVTLKTAKQERNTERAIDAIESGDTIGFENAIGNPNAGKPSGLGKIRDKK